MVYLNPPFHVIDGVSVFSDHEDPLQFYFMPMMPKLTAIQDSKTGELVPQIQLIKYRGRAGKGGFLNFDVNLDLEQDKLESVRSQLMNLHKLKETPRLAPVPLVDGTVKLMLLGKESKTPNPAGTPTTPPPTEEPATNEAAKFVVSISHHAKPALYGSNQASFSVELDQAGVTVLEQALQGQMSPIGVVYALDYLALRPAYSVKVHADWDRVQHHLQESFGASFLFFSADIDKVVDELIESRAITIEIDNYIPPGDDAADVIGRLDQAVNEVKDMVLENFFEPSIDPMKSAEEEDGWDKFAATAERLALMHATGGLSGMAGFTIKNVDLTRIDKKRLDVSMSERTTVKRSIYPQAHLRGLFHWLKNLNYDLSRFVIEVDLDDEWFEERRMKVISRANFATDNVESINVRLKYNNKIQNVLLDANNLQQTVTWNNAKMSNGTYQRMVETSYKVAFKNIDRNERPVLLSSPKEFIDVENFEIRPHELYSLLQIPVLALDFPWNLYPQVEVQTRYNDAQNNLKIEDTFILESKSPEKRWNLFTLDPNLDTFEYKLIYRSADHKDIELQWGKSNAEQIIIRDPFPRKRKLEVVSAINWRDISTVYVDLSYEDVANEVFENFSLRFQANEAQSKVIEVKKFVNPENRFIKYKATLVHQDGRVTELPLSTTRAERIFISNQFRSHQIIMVKPDAVSFVSKKLKQVEVALKYEDASAGLAFNEVFIFKSHEDRPGYFEFDWVDKAKTAIEYTVKYIYKNGLQKSSPKQASTEKTLAISII